jgi:hypothetical protein
MQTTIEATGSDDKILHLQIGWVVFHLRRFCLLYARAIKQKLLVIFTDKTSGKRMDVMDRLFAACLGCMRTTPREFRIINVFAIAHRLCSDFVPISNCVFRLLLVAMSRCVRDGHMSHCARYGQPAPSFAFCFCQLQHVLKKQI